MDNNELKKKLMALSQFKPVATETIIRSNAGLVIKQEKSNMNPKTERNPNGGGREKGKPQPHLVKYHGEQAEMRLAWLRMKAQCKYRKEEFNLTFDQFEKIWNGKWSQRGRGGDDLVLTRVIDSASWNIFNCQLVKRRDVTSENQKGRWNDKDN